MINRPTRAIFDALIRREQLGSTAIGGGVAIPHSVFIEIKATLKVILTTKRAGVLAGLGIEKFGGAKRDRTADLYNAIVALSQLSYSPICFQG